MIVSLIVAKANNNGIGKNNDLLWHMPKDMNFFKETTKGHCVIMGRKNYDSIPEKYRPLPGRPNIIVTRNTEFSAEYIDVTHSIEDALEVARAKGENEAFVIGGGQIYKEALSKGLIDKMYITHVDADIEADTFFPAFEEQDWEVEDRFDLEKDERNPYYAEVVTYLKK